MPFKDPLHGTLSLKMDRQERDMEEDTAKTRSQPGAFHIAHAHSTNPVSASRTPSVLTFPTPLPRRAALQLFSPLLPLHLY